MRTIFTLLMICISLYANGQNAAQYVLARNNAGSPSTITGGSGTVALTDLQGDNATLQSIPIGFSFVYCGTTYTSLSACSNGWLSLANSSSTAFANAAGSIVSAGMLMPCWDDLDGSGATVFSYYQTSGTAPNRVFTFQWGQTAPATARWGTNVAAASGRACFQAKLYESSNVVEYQYLTANYSGNSSTVGISNSTSDYLTLPTTTSTTANTTFTTNLGNTPAVNVVLGWTPPPTITVSPSSLSFTAVASGFSTAQSVTLVAYGLTAGVTVTAPTNFQVYNGTAWVSSFTVSTSTAAVGTYINTAVQVRFAGPATPGTYTGNVTFTSTGATTKNVAVTGDVVAVCGGTPTPGTASATATSGSCSSYSSTLSTTGTSSSPGITYQWQSSPDNTTYANVAGATNTTYAATVSGNIYYRALIGCSNSGLSATTSGILLSYTPPPTAITGSSIACVSSTTTLSSTPSGGAWTTSNSDVATVSSGGGVTGVIYGTANVTYTSSGCSVSKTISVNVPPSAVSVGPSSSATVCLGSGSSFTASTSNHILLDQNFNSDLGAWSINNNSGVAASYWQIRNPPGYSYSAIDGDGTAFIQAAPDATTSNTHTQLISPSFSTVGYTSATLTYNQEYESYGGDNAVNVQISINGGSSWSTILNQKGTDDYSYSWTAASPQVTITIPAAAIGQPSVMIRWNYNSTYGFWWALDNIRVTAPTTATYAWTGPAGLSCTTCTNPTITPTATGANVYTITATANSCTTTNSVTMNVNPLPATIGGTAAVCVGLTTTLTDATSGGTWISGNTGVATIGSSSGIVTSITAGTATISYIVTATGCSITKVVTVNALPANITGTASACVGAATTLADITSPGTWASGTVGIAAVGPSSGIVSGVLAGLATITYTATSTGCIKTVQVTINPLPATTITPSSSTTICMGDSTSFTAFAPQPAFNILLQDFNSGLGAWTLVNTSGNAASYWQVTSTPATSITGDGTAMLEANSDLAYSSASVPLTTILVSPSFSTVGYGTATVSFNEYLVSAPSDDNVDVDYSINGGSTWTNISGQVGVGFSSPGGGTGSWTSSGTPEVSLSLPAAALDQPDVKLRWHYNANAGLYWDIDNIKVTAYQPAVTYAWSGVAGATGLSCSSCGTPTITPAATGSNIYSVTSTTSASCQSTLGVTVSVNPSPAAITGASAVCVNSTITLADADAGGTWSSGEATVSVDATSGVVTGVSAGPATISYSLATGCAKTMAITVNPLPAAITGVMQVCEGLTTSLSSTTGGTWGATVPGVATIDVNTGVVSGIDAGTSSITYTLTATGCAISTTVTVNDAPAAITGTMHVCEGLTTTLGDTDAGGTWASGTTSIATVEGASGVVTAIDEGATTITYQAPGGCISTAIVTVDPLPAAITGIMQVCEGLTTTLSSTTSGGTWSIGTASVATVGATTGIVSGDVMGTAGVDYTLTATGCAISATVTVNHTPVAITGDLQVCAGLTTTLTNTDGGGTWTSGTTVVATIGNATGVVSAIADGTTTITYQLPAGCITTADVTVNPLPAAITGVMQVCQGLTTALDNFTTGGAWSSGSINASVDASGVVTGSTAGVETITYQLPTTCLQTADVTVNPTPAVITGMMEVCEGLTTALSNGDAGGTWTSGATVTVTVDATTGVVTGIDDGVATITYRLPTTCINTADVTVNPLPAAITGATQVCVGLTTTLGNTSGGGTWSNTPGAAIIDGSGVVLGMSDGITTITYTLPTGCIITTDVTVNPLPAAINGTMQVCAGLTATLSDATTGGTWSSGPSLAAAVDATGIVTASTAGNTMITYTLPTSCIATAEVTVNPLPHTIAGTRAVCEGLTTALSDADAGGTWLSSITTVASIDASGVVSGILAGTTSITYTLPTGCIISSDVTVNPLPAPITGTMQVCAGLTTTLASITPAGTWSSGAPATATVGVSTGVVSASVEGVATITYALPTGCLTSAEVTVNPLPAAIVGSLQVCLGAATSLTNASAGGTWSTSAVVASINATTGVANGIAIGNSTITYTLPTSCKMTAGITVNPLPAPITGPSQFCEGTAALYGNGSPGGTWSSSTILVASIDPAGEAAGNASGTTLITYTLGTGCSRVRPVTVNSLPAAITGTMQVCQAGTAMLADGTPGGSWISGNISVATINSAGLFNGMSAGTTAIYYRMPTGCMTTATVTVNQMPAAITAPGGTVICEGQTTTLANTVAGGSWISNAATIASVDPVTGVVTGVSAGSAYITYMLPEGCSRAVAISVNAMPAAITGASQMCQGSTTVMTTTSTGGAWTSSATSVASINLTSGVVTGLAAGFASISYTNVAGGCTVVKSISVDPLPAALIGSSNVCEGQTTAISSTSTGGTWTSSNNTVAIVGTSGTISALGSGSSVISYQLSTGCMRSVIVTVNPSPAVYNMTGGGNYCASGSGLHVGLTNSMGGVSYQLYAGSTLVGSPVAGVTGMPLDFGTIAPAGSYSATATIAATGCTSNMAGIVTVTVTALVPASVSLSTGTGSDTVCSGIPVSFAAAATNGGTSPVYQWMVNGVVIAGATSNAYSYLPATGDVISVDMTSSIGCASPLMATAAKTMTVNTSVMPVAGIAVTPGTNLCAGNTVTFSASSLFGGSAPAFVWMKNGTTAATGATYTYTPADGDIVYVKLAGNHTCSLADTVLSSSVTMAVAPLYMPLVNITADPGTTVNVGTNVTLTANVSNGGPSPEFQWYIGTSSIVGATSANFSYNMYSDGDSVSCQVKGTGVCGFGGFNSIIMHLGGTGIAVPADMGDVRLMPNPNKGEFAVKGALAAKADKEVAIEVTNMLGQVVYKTNVMTRNGDIDAKIKLDNTLANGMYILSLISEGQKSVMHFVVEQ